MGSSRKQLLLAGSSILICGLSLSLSVPSSAADLPVYEPVPDVQPLRTLTGVVDMYAGWRWLDGQDTDDADDSYGLIGGDAKVDIPFSETFSLQLDFGGEWTGAEGSDSTSAEENYTGSVDAAAHLNYRQMDRYLIGLYGGGGAVFEADTDSTDQGARFWHLGIEGQYYFGNSTIYGQVGWVDSDEISNAGTNDYIEDAWYIRAVGRHYFNQGRTKGELEVSWLDGDHNGGDDVTYWGFGAELEHQFSSFGNDGGVNGFIRYDGRWIESDWGGGDDTANTHTLMAGVSFDFNSQSLLQRERSGVALDTLNWGQTLGDIHYTDD